MSVHEVMKPIVKNAGWIKKIKLRWVLLAVVILAVLVVLVPGRPKPVPDDLIEVWITQAPGYEDRFIEITKVSLIYGIGGYNIHVYFIAKLERAIQGKDVVYTVYFHNLDGLDYKKSFYYDPANDGTIRFKNQKHIVWTRQKQPY